MKVVRTSRIYQFVAKSAKRRVLDEEQTNKTSVLMMPNSMSTPREREVCIYMYLCRTSIDVGSFALADYRSIGPLPARERSEWQLISDSVDDRSISLHNHNHRCISVGLEMSMERGVAYVLRHSWRAWYHPE